MLSLRSPARGASSRACAMCALLAGAPAAADPPAASAGDAASARAAVAPAAIATELERVTVTAGRPTTMPLEIPTTIESVTGAQVEKSINATDAEDALKYLPSLSVRKRYIGDYDHAVLATRASGTGNSARSLVYADGILLSNLLGNGAAFTPRWGARHAGGDRARRRALRTVLGGLPGQLGRRDRRLRDAHAEPARGAREAAGLHASLRTGCTPPTTPSAAARRARRSAAGPARSRGGSRSTT